MASSGNARQQRAGGSPDGNQQGRQERPQMQSEPRPPYPQQKLDKPGLEAEMELLFATLGEPAEGGRAFIQPMRLNLLRRG